MDDGLHDNGRRPILRRSFVCLAGPVTRNGAARQSKPLILDGR